MQYRGIRGDFMKTLILYDRNTGDIISTQSPVEHDNYAVLVTDIPDNRVVARVENGEVILEDIPEVKKIKERLKQIEIEKQKCKKDLLLIEMGLK